MRPDWTDVLRFPPGTLLGVTLTLAPALREAVRPLLTGLGLALDSVQSTTLEVLQLGPDGGELRCCAGERSALLALRTGAAGDRAVAVQASVPGRPGPFALERLALQTGGAHEAYVARCEGSARVPLLRLRYERDGNTVRLAAFGVGLMPWVPPSLKAWVPAELPLAELRPLRAATGRDAATMP